MQHKAFEDIWQTGHIEQCTPEYDTICVQKLMASQLI